MARNSKVSQEPAQPRLPFVIATCPYDDDNRGWTGKKGETDALTGLAEAVNHARSAGVAQILTKIYLETNGKGQIKKTARKRFPADTQTILDALALPGEQFKLRCTPIEVSSTSSLYVVRITCVRKKS